jgi:hypothetical protein
MCATGDHNATRRRNELANQVGHRKGSRRAPSTILVNDSRWRVQTEFMAKLCRTREALASG